MASFGLILDDVTGNFIGLDPPESRTYSSPQRGVDAVTPHSSNLQGAVDSKLFEVERLSNSSSGYISIHDTSIRSDSKSREKDRKIDRDNSSDSKVWAASNRTRESPAPSRRNDERLEDTPVIARSSGSSQQGKDRAGVVQGIPGRGQTPAVPVSNVPVPVSTLSEAKTPLARHGRNNSSSSVISSPPPCIPPSPPPQAYPQTSYVPSSRVDATNQALLTPVPAPPNVHVEYSESSNDDVDRIQSVPSSVRNGTSYVDKNSKKGSLRVEKEVESEGENNFLGSYNVPVSLWSVGLQLDVVSLLTHASDSQVD